MEVQPLEPPTSIHIYSTSSRSPHWW